MINGGNATVYFSNMDSSITFYTEVLGLKLPNRFGNNWATVQADPDGNPIYVGDWDPDVDEHKQREAVGSTTR